MSALGHLIVELSVRGHFGAPLHAGPVLGSAQQPGTISLAPEIFSDVPALDVAYRMLRIAVIGMRAQAHFEETDQRPVRNLGDENGERQRPPESAGEYRDQFLRVLFR